MPANESPVVLTIDPTPVQSSALPIFDAIGREICNSVTVDVDVGDIAIPSAVPLASRKNNPLLSFVVVMRRLSPVQLFAADPILGYDIFANDPTEIMNVRRKRMCFFIVAFSV
jgi:hypothetical protein